MVIDSEYKCTVCGTMRGIPDPITGKPWRSRNGWCRACSARGGKPIVDSACIDCKTMGGEQRRRKDGSCFIIRIQGRCNSCYAKKRRKSRKEQGRPLIYKRKKPVSASTVSLDSLSNAKIESEIKKLKNKHISKILESSKIERVDVDHESRIELMRCIQDYRRATRNWTKIKAYKLDAAKETESVLLSA